MWLWFMLEVAGSLTEAKLLHHIPRSIQLWGTDTHNLHRPTANHTDQHRLKKPQDQCSNWGNTSWTNILVLLPSLVDQDESNLAQNTYINTLYISLQRLATDTQSVKLPASGSSSTCTKRSVSALAWTPCFLQQSNHMASNLSSIQARLMDSSPTHH